MKDRSYYEKLFTSYPEEVSKQQFKEMLGGLSENTARDWIKKGKVKSRLIKCKADCKKDTVTTIKKWIPKKSVINYLIEKNKDSDAQYTEFLKEYYQKKFKNLPDMLSVKKARKIVGISFEEIKELMQSNKIEIYLQKTPKKINIQYQVSCTMYMISKKSIIDYVTSDNYQKNSIRRKANI